MITASICAIGDELLIGQVKDTNSSYIALALNAIGIRIDRIYIVGDVPADILHVLDLAKAQSNLIILTGGLGPTKDDMTKDLLYKYTGARSYVHIPEQEAIIRSICEKRHMGYSGLNAGQSNIPDTAEGIINDLGTAPGMWFSLPATSAYGHHTRAIVSLPGVPFEMKALLDKVIFKAREFFQISPIFHKTLCTYGIPESALAERITSWEEHLPHGLHLAYLPDPVMGVRLRLSMYGAGSQDILNKAFEDIKGPLGESVYGEDNDSLASVTASLVMDRGATLSTAESCTGGRIAQMFTSMPGASQYFMGSVVAYHNRIKESVLGVDPQTLNLYGAVSRECVEEMAAGVQRAFGTTYSLATSGIAGPSGGSAEKPVGLVWIAVAGPSGIVSESWNFPGSRTVAIDRFAATALDLLRRTILKDKSKFII